MNVEVIKTSKPKNPEKIKTMVVTRNIMELHKS